MSQKFTVIEKPAIQYLCGLIRDLANVSEGIDDLNLRSNGTFSSVKINTLLNTLKTDCNEYTDRLVANLSRLELKIANAESEITQPNIMYLYKPSGSTSYEQYVVVGGVKVLLGTTDIKMSDYYTITQADAKFVLKTDFDSLKTKVDGKVDKTNIIAANDTSATDDQVYSAKAINTELDKVVKKTDIVDNLTSTDTDKPLSANQGKVLKGEVDLKANDDEVVKKTDINNISCVIISEVDFKEYVKTNCNKLYKRFYYITSPSCTGIPKSDYFYVIVDRIGANTFYITATTTNNAQYICTYNIDNDGWTPWERVCTTSVVDVTNVNVILNDEANYSKNSPDWIKYEVHNGVCYLSILVNCVSPVSDYVILSDVPKPRIAKQINCGGWGINSKSDMVSAYISPDGTLGFRNGTAGGLYQGTISYPIAE